MNSHDIDPGGSPNTRRYAASNYSGADFTERERLAEQAVATLPKATPPDSVAVIRRAAATHREALEQALAAIVEAEGALKGAAEAARVARIEDWISGYLAVQLGQWREKVATQLERTE